MDRPQYGSAGRCRNGALCLAGVPKVGSNYTIAGAKKHRVVVADGPGKWRDELMAFLSEDDDYELSSVDTGDDLLRLLMSPRKTGPQFVIIGNNLADPSGLDALYLVHEAKKNAKGERDEAQCILMIAADVRFDVELQELLRGRGITQFLPTVDVAKASKQIRTAIHCRERSDVRYPIQCDVDIVVKGEKFSGTIEDLSRSGMRIDFAKRLLSGQLALGDSLSLHGVRGPDGEPLDIKFVAEVRWLRSRRRFFSETVSLGVLFTDLDEATVAAVQQIIDDWVQTQEQKMVMNSAGIVGRNMF